jgi:hypothetical protein
MSAMPNTLTAPYDSVYRIRWFWRTFALVFVVLGAGSGWDIGRKVFSGLQRPGVIDMVVVAILLIAGLVMTIHFFSARVFFTREMITHRTIFGTRCLPLNGSRGRRVCVVRGGGPDEGGNTRYLKLDSSDDCVPGLSFSASYTFDEAFYRWFFSLPDLDMRKESGEDSNRRMV